MPEIALVKIQMIEYSKSLIMVGFNKQKQLLDIKTKLSNYEKTSTICGCFGAFGHLKSSK